MSEKKTRRENKLEKDKEKSQLLRDNEKKRKVQKQLDCKSIMKIKR